jgi:hypothetical protein
MQASVNANLVAEIPEQDFYFVDIPNLLSGWPNERSDVSPVRFRYGKLPLIRANCAVHENLIKSLLRDCWSADRKAGQQAHPALTEKKHVVCSLLPILPLPHHAAAADISSRTNQSGDSIKRDP